MPINTARASYPEGERLTHRTGAEAQKFFPCAQERFSEPLLIYAHQKEEGRLDLDVNIDPGKLLQFHDAMLCRVQDDERARRSWERSESADLKRRREELAR